LFLGGVFVGVLVCACWLCFVLWGGGFVVWVVGVGCGGGGWGCGGVVCVWDLGVMVVGGGGGFVLVAGV
ncbi:hypothetical protein RA264_28320, partial [Pseudomonas syringae pv. tagetis]|uniref:hypothetical protein n=1 Tax=Pseudomonas syringae group genomosp. 7 TaxID=251699 RepID=UPI003770083B